MNRIILVLLIAAAPSLLAQTSSVYRITHTYTLGGEGSWDYVVPDPPNHRLFIGRQNRVMVVDENDGKLLGEVPTSTERTEWRWSIARVTDSPHPATTLRW